MAIGAIAAVFWTILDTFLETVWCRLAGEGVQVFRENGGVYSEGEYEVQDECGGEMRCERGHPHMHRGLGFRVCVQAFELGINEDIVTGCLSRKDSKARMMSEGNQHPFHTPKKIMRAVLTDGRIPLIVKLALQNERRDHGRYPVVLY